MVFMLAAFCASAAPACTSGIGLSSPRAMNHPVDVAFVCFDTTVVGLPTVRPLSDCALHVDVASNTRQPPLNTAMHMHALVTQRTRGEVAAVDLIARGELDSDMSVPGYTFVPVGEQPTQIVVPPTDPTCTYVASRGPVDGRHPGISIIDTRRFRSGAGLDHNPFPLHAPYILPSAPADMLLAPDGASFWIALDALSVVVRVPILGSCELGTIDLVVPLYEDVPPGVAFTAGSTVDLTRQCLLAAGTAPVAPYVVPPRNPAVDPSAEPQPVALAFDVDNGVLLVADRTLPMIHRVNVADGTLLRPLATGVPVRDVVVTPRVPNSYDLVPDPCAFDTATGRHAPGSAIPAPTTFSRYVYAIDETDGTVLAIEYSDESAVGFGEVIPVDVRGARRPDRVAMPIVARSLEIVTPQYDTNAADPRFAPADPGDPSGCSRAFTGNPSGFGLCLPNDPAPVQPPSPVVLRGVFLVVASTDGALRFVDVYDLDAPCRGRAFAGAAAFDASGSSINDCTTPTVTGDNAIYIRRHRPRVQQLLSTFVTVGTGPTVFFRGGGSVVLGTDGVPTGQTPPTVPCMTTANCATDAGLVCRRGFCVSADETPALRLFADDHNDAAIACPAGLGMVWGATESLGMMSATRNLPIVCSLVDPFAAISETWSAVYEGSLPGTFTSSANAHVDLSTHTFDGNIDTRTDYCARGVIGREQATAPAVIGEPEGRYQGDMLAITGIIPSANLEGMGGLCRQVVNIAQIGEPQQPILARIQRAFTLPTGAPAQQQPYTGRLFVDPTTPLENRGAGFVTQTACDPTTTDSCPTADHPHDVCDATLRLCRTFPTISDAIRCFGDTLLTIDVRSFQAFTVSGTRSGFSTRVVRAADGTCEYDLAGDPLRQGHAFNDTLFRNARIAFRPTGVSQTTLTNELAEIRMVLTGGSSQLGIDLSLSSTGVRSMALPTGLHYSPEMWALYGIETERGGLVEMTLRPLSRTQTAYQ